MSFHHGVFSYISAEIQSNTDNSAVEVHQLDTSSLTSVRTFASKILAEKQRSVQCRSYDSGYRVVSELEHLYSLSVIYTHTEF